jgi:4-alpha-glucanotransferase
LIDPELAALADAYGVATEYWDQAGQHVSVSVETISAVLRALGVQCSTSTEIAQALADHRLREWRRFLPPIFLTRHGQHRRAWVHVPHGAPAAMWIELADGTRIDLEQMDWWVHPVDVDGVLTGEASFAVPDGLPIGWHRLHAQSEDRTESIDLGVAPTRLNPDEILGGRQWGLMSQIYALRSRDSWGMGDIHDTTTLATWSAGLGAGFLLVNPLHATEPTSPISPSPYLPTSRRFTSPLYVRVSDIPEWGLLPERARAALEAKARNLRALNASNDLLDRDRVWKRKRKALRAVFAMGLSTDRQTEFANFCQQQGEGLRDFAIWCALAEKYGTEYQKWPKRFRHPQSKSVRAFAKKREKRIRFHEWLQWISYEQLQAMQSAARQSGMAVGIISDLAVGVHKSGADAWALQDVLTQGATVGAPPDMYNQLGQDWQQPPWRPDALANVAYLPFRTMLRNLMATSGGVRIDHILGLFRMWWVPRGMNASEGTYVTFDHDALLNILSIEAALSESIVVGEDLGTVAEYVQRELADRGLLGTSILWFEAGAHGEVLLPQHWRRNVLASVSVHDLPPTAGYLRDEHVRIRAELGLLTGDPTVEYANAAAERARWRDVLVGQGWLAESVDVDSEAGKDEMLAALYRALAASPCVMLGIGVPDVVEDRRAQNQPGTNREYPNWCVPVADASGAPVLLETLMAYPEWLLRLRPQPAS